MMTISKVTFVQKCYHVEVTSVTVISQEEMSENTNSRSHTLCSPDLSMRHECILHVSFLSLAHV